MKNNYLLFLITICCTIPVKYGQAQTNIFPPSGKVGIGTTSPAGGLEVSYAGGQIRLSGGVVAGGIWTNATDILYLADWNTGTKGLNINMSSGNVGIGTTSPVTKLDVNGSINILNNNNITWGGAYGAGIPTIAAGMTSGIFFYPAGSTSGASMRIASDGNVGIGTTSPDYKLTVNGKIKAEEIQVVVDVPADFVFEKNYTLMPLAEVEKFVTKNKHLPGMPNAQSLIANGWPVGEMNNKLLEKVEELTLYLIDMKKEIDQMKKENEELKKSIKKINRNGY